MGYSVTGGIFRVIGVTQGICRINTVILFSSQDSAAGRTDTPGHESIFLKNLSSWFLIMYQLVSLAKSFNDNVKQHKLHLNCLAGNKW